MHLDTPTLLATITIAYFAGAIVLGSLAAVMRSLPSNIRYGWALWAVAMLLSGTCAILFGLRGIAPDVLSIILANALLLIGFGLRPNALSLLNGRGIAYPWLPGIAAAIWLGLYLFPWFREEISLRVVFVNGLCLLSITLCIRECWQQMHQAQFSSRFLIAVFAFDALTRISVVGLFFNLNIQSLKDAFHTPELTIVLIVVLFAIVLKVVGLGVAVFERLKRQYQKQAQRDPLTGLFNRRAFMNYAEANLHASTKSSDPYSLVTLEVDALQKIINRFGPSMGDALMNLLCQVCIERAENPAITGRVRDNQVTIYLPNTDKIKASSIANGISQSFAAQATRAFGNQLKITVSSGLFWGGNQTTLARAMEIADHCLNQAKTDGGNQIQAHGASTEGPLNAEKITSPFAPRRPKAA